MKIIQFQNSVHMNMMLFLCTNYIMNWTKLKYFNRFFSGKEPTQHLNQTSFQFKPTSYLSHPFLQSIYNLYEPQLQFNFQRQRIFFQDGGHISLDWSSENSKQPNPPILFIMHGLTGGSQMNYIRALMKEANQQGFQCVCLNSRGINNEMTSPIPFTAIQHHQLDVALNRVQLYYPKSRIFMVGTSFGGNYLIRYLLKKRRESIKGLVALAPPLKVNQVIDDMAQIYQGFFVKRYIYETVTKHPQMQYWEKIGLVDMKKVLKSKTLNEFHNQVTCKILGFSQAKQLFDQYEISNEEIEKLDMDTLFMVSKDDPIVSYESMPIENIKKNKKIQFVATEKGGHLCWFEGSIPKRWYPRPTVDYLKRL